MFKLAGTALKIFNSKNTADKKSDLPDAETVSQEYAKEYSEEGFWQKVKTYAKDIGESSLEKALKMYYATRDPETPTWAKTAIYGSLGYLILPVDVVPDLLPVAGYTDDVGVLSAALAAVAVNIKTEHVDKAKETLKQWFD